MASDEKKLLMRQVKQRLSGPIYFYNPTPEIPFPAQPDVSEAGIQSAEESLLAANLALNRYGEQMQILKRYGPHVLNVVERWQGGRSPEIRTFFTTGQYLASLLPDEDGSLGVSMLDLYMFWYVCNFSESIPRAETNMILYRGQGLGTSPAGVPVEQLTKPGEVVPHTISNWSTAPFVSLAFTSAAKDQKSDCCMIRVFIPKGAKFLALPQVSESEYILWGGQYRVAEPPALTNLTDFPLWARRHFKHAVNDIKTYSLIYEPGKQQIEWPASQMAEKLKIEKIPKANLEQEFKTKFIQQQNRLTNLIKEAQLVKTKALQKLKQPKIKPTTTTTIPTLPTLPTLPTVTIALARNSVATNMILNGGYGRF